MARFAASLVFLAALACAGDEEAPLGSYGELCDDTHLCAQSLVCLNKFCTARCSGNDPAACIAASAGNTCVTGTCFTSCTTTFNCPPGLTCTMAGSTMGTCRPGL
jgi:hypothetical protein